MWRRACKRSSREEVYGGGEKSASFLRGIFGLREFLIWLGAVKNVVCERKFLGLLQSAIHSKFCNFNKKTVNIELHNNVKMHFPQNCLFSNRDLLFSVTISYGKNSHAIKAH